MRVAGPLSRANRWRSETLTAMTKSPEFKERKDEKVSELLESFVEDLKTWISTNMLGKGQIKDQLQKDVLEPAVKLHTAMTCSRENYRLIHPRLVQRELERDHTQWTLKSIDTWRPANPSENQILFGPLFPGLYRVRHREHAESEFELVKPVVMVYKSNNVRTVSTSSTWPRSEQDTIERHSHRSIKDARARSLSRSTESVQADRKKTWTSMFTAKEQRRPS